MAPLDTGTVLLAFGLTVFAGLATGMMIYVALIKIFVKAKDALTVELGHRSEYWATVGAFFQRHGHDCRHR